MQKLILSFKVQHETNLMKGDNVNVHMSSSHNGNFESIPSQTYVL